MNDPFCIVPHQGGDGSEDRWWRLIAPAVNFSHKATCAVVIGVYGLMARSWSQLGWLMALQVQDVVHDAPHDVILA